MKLLGLACGRKMQNCEILLKEALHEADKMGIEVKMLRLPDLDLKPCRGCIACVMSLQSGGSGECVIKDDFRLVSDLILDCDGFILAAPVFNLGPHSIVKMLTDRLGPSHDAYFRSCAKKFREEHGITKGKGPDERSFKKRIAGFITVGGAHTPNWLSLSLPMMHIFSMAPSGTVVDQMQVTDSGRFMNVVLNPEAIERARVLGRNVAEAMKKPVEQAAWMGDGGAICPSCHSNLLTVSGKNPVECPICGTSGTLKLDGNKISVAWDKDELKRSRMTDKGKKEHIDEINNNLAIFLQRPDKEEIPERVKKYASPEYESFVIPAPKKMKAK